MPARATRAMFPGAERRRIPPAPSLWRARFADQAKRRHDPQGLERRLQRCAGAHGDLTHDGIDHVLVSESLKRRLEPSALTMRVENYTDDAGAPLRADPALALPSDHCPHVVVWTPKRRP